MNRKLMLVIGGVPVLAMGVAAALYFRGKPAAPDGGGDPDAIVEGKLSRRLIEVEAKFKEAQRRWGLIQPEVVKPGSGRVPELKEIDKLFKEAAGQAKAAEGRTDLEKQALPHLQAAAEASAQIPEIFLLYSIHAAAVSDADKKRAITLGDTANREWREWSELTAGLKR